jgi:hypothetical protein
LADLVDHIFPPIEKVDESILYNDWNYWSMTPSALDPHLFPNDQETSSEPESSDYEDHVLDLTELLEPEELARLD